MQALLQESRGSSWGGDKAVHGLEVFFRMLLADVPPLEEEIASWVRRLSAGV